MAISSKIEAFLDDIVEMHLSEIRAGNQEYMELNREMVEAGEEIKKVLRPLEEEQRKIFSDLETLRNQEQSIENRLLYRAGIRDAVKLLKEIGVI